MRSNFRQWGASLASVLLALSSATAASAATSEYPNGADGGDGNLDNINGFYSENRQLDFDFLLSVFDDYISDLLPSWNTGGTPVWTTVTHQEGPNFYGFDNNANGIVDSDHLDALAAIVNGGEAVTSGVLGGDIAAIQSAFATNRAAVQNREVIFPRVTITAFGFITVSVDNVKTGANITVAGNDIYVPSLWSKTEVATTTEPDARGLLGGAAEMLEIVLRDYIAAQMTLCPGTGSTEIAHIQSFMQVFLTEFLRTQLPGILANAGEVTPRSGNNFTTFDIDLDVTTEDIGTIRVRIAGSGQGSQHVQQAITHFRNSFSPTPPTTTWSGAGYGSGTPAAPGAWPAPNFVSVGGDGTLAASGDLNRDATTNAASYTAAAENRQDFMANEGIVVPPLQFIPIPLSAVGILDGLTVLGDDEWSIEGGDDTERAYDWETVDQLEYTFTDPVLGGDTTQSTYVMDPSLLAQGGLYYSMQVADDTWTRTVPAFLLNLEAAEGEGAVEGEGAIEGTLEGEGAAEGEGAVEGTLEGEGAAEGEGAVEGVLEGEGAAEGEGAVEGALEGEGAAEGAVEGTLEGEGAVEGEDCELPLDIPGTYQGINCVNADFCIGETVFSPNGSFSSYYSDFEFEQQYTGEWCADPSASPGQLDITITEYCSRTDELKGTSLDCESVALQYPGIYEIEGCILRYGYNTNQTRPASFEDAERVIEFELTGCAVEGEGAIEGEGAVEGALEGEGAIEGEGAVEGVLEGEGAIEGEGTVEGALEGEGAAEGEGAVEGALEGEGAAEGEGAVEGALEGEGAAEGEGAVEGTLEGEGAAEGEGAVEGEGEGVVEEGEDENLINIANALLRDYGSIDSNSDGFLSLAELTAYLGNEPTPEELADFDANEDGRIQVSELLAITGPSWVHSADVDGDGVVSLSDLLRCVQIFNQGGYSCAANAGATEDGFLAAPGGGDCKRHASDYNGEAADGQFDLQELLRLIQMFNAGGYLYCPEELESEDGYCIVLD